MSTLLGYRKWSIAVLVAALGFTAALFGKLSPELAGLLGTIATGFFAANGYTTRNDSKPAAPVNQ